MSSVCRGDQRQIAMLHLDPLVRRYLGGPVDASLLEGRMERYLRGDPDDHYWAVRTRQTNIFLGLVSLTPHHDNHDIEVSYEFLPEFWGNEYATETVSAVVQHAESALNAPRIVAETQSENHASCRLLEKIGMRFDRHVIRCGKEQSIYVTT